METEELLTTIEIEHGMFKWPFAEVAANLKASVIREVLKISNKPGVINFAGGLPAPELFPVERIKQCVDHVLTERPAQSLQYSVTQGVPELRELIAENASRKGLPVAAENIQITTGSQQGLDLVGRAFISPGDYVLTERPTYLGALQAFNFYQARYCTADMDEGGIIIDQVEEQIKKHKPKMIYVVPNFQNPSGITMNLERRKELVRLAFEYQIPIIDDNPYGELRYSGTPKPSLRGLGGDAVIQLGTYSKLISPGMRVGWIVAPTAALKVIEKVKQAADLHSTTFCQYIIYEFLRRGWLEEHIEVIKEAYARRRDVMDQALKEYFPDCVTWPHPHGGLFLWLRFPAHVSTAKMFEEAVAEKVAFVPGASFHPNGGGENTCRLNFATSGEETILEGIKRLSRVVARHC
ncbi:MAG: PLP-dependent aminotransferase family protein [bacterium]